MLQTPLTVLSWMSANVSVRALVYGLLLGAAGLLPFVMVRAQGWSYAVACLIAAVMALLTVELAALVAPFLLGFAALLGCAAAVSLLGERWRPKTPDERRTA